MDTMEPRKDLAGVLVDLQDVLEGEIACAAHADHAMAGMAIMLLARQLAERGLIDYARFLREASEISAMSLDAEMAHNPFFQYIRQNYLNQFRAGGIWEIEGGRK